MKNSLVFVAFALTLASSAALAETPSTALSSDKHAVWNGQEVTFGNGAKIKVDGSTLTTTAEGATSTVDRGKTPPPPRIMASCSYMRRWLDSHPVNNNWRANSLTYMDKCF